MKGSTKSLHLLVQYIGCFKNSTHLLDFFAISLEGTVFYAEAATF